MPDQTNPPTQPSPERSAIPPYDHAKVAAALAKYGPLGAGKLYNTHSGQSCAIGALCRAAGWTKDSLIGGASNYAATYGPTLEQRYGIRRAWVTALCNVNDDPRHDERRTEIVLAFLDWCAAGCPEESRPVPVSAMSVSGWERLQASLTEAPMPEPTPPVAYDRAKVEQVLRSEPLGGGLLFNRSTGKCCALGALARAAGWSDEQIERMHHVSFETFRGEFAPMLEQTYGIPFDWRGEVAMANDCAPEFMRPDAVLEALDRLAASGGGTSPLAEEF